ncbi:MAG: hypothetical protein IPJ17_01155 [Holophagales bacterium]|nr:MAG: hypothetical protein IPJ17_01155 [Holophagales bacterium]
MPVYDRSWRPYDGTLTPLGRRFLVISRQALSGILAVRLHALAFFAACLPPLVFTAIIYGANNLEALTLIGVRAQDAFAIDTGFFYRFLVAQVAFGSVFTALVAPALVAPDLAHDALVLVLARPIDRRDYVLGKLVALAVLLSAVTWVPGLLLFGIQASLAGGDWFTGHLRIAAALFVGSWLWILTVGVVALAVSAWVRWRPVATAAVLGVFLVGKGLGEAFNQVLDTTWGRLLVVDDLIVSVWAALFGREQPEGALPMIATVLGIAAFWLAALRLLARRLRAREVSR